MLQTSLFFDCIKDFKRASKSFKDQLRKADDSFADEQILPHAPLLRAIESDITHFCDERERIEAAADEDVSLTEVSLLQQLRADAGISEQILCERLGPTLQFAPWAKQEIASVLEEVDALQSRVQSSLSFDGICQPEISRFTDNKVMHIEQAGICVLDARLHPEESHARMYEFEISASIYEGEIDHDIVMHYVADLKEQGRTGLRLAALGQFSECERERYYDAIFVATLEREFPLNRTVLPALRETLTEKFIGQIKTI